MRHGLHRTGTRSVKYQQHFSSRNAPRGHWSLQAGSGRSAPDFRCRSPLIGSGNVVFREYLLVYRSSHSPGVFASSERGSALIRRIPASWLDCLGSVILLTERRTPNGRLLDDRVRLTVRWLVLFAFVKKKLDFIGRLWVYVSRKMSFCESALARKSNYRMPFFRVESTREFLSQEKWFLRVAHFFEKFDFTPKHFS